MSGKIRILLGLLVFIEDAGSNHRKCKLGKFKCFCNNKFVAKISDVKSSKVKSCGCMREKHGDAGNRLYRIYHKIKWRCEYPTNPWYGDYGGKGIKICEEWSKYSAFKKWSLSNGYDKRLTIDRIDNDKNYEPSNCRWISQKLQNINQRTRKDNKTGFVGVSFCKDCKENPWIAQIVINKKRFELGSFKTPEEASEAYQKSRKEREELYLKEEQNLENINYRKVAKI